MLVKRTPSEQIIYISLSMQAENKQLLMSVFMLSLYIFILSPLTIVIENYKEFQYGFIEIAFPAFYYFFPVFLILASPVFFPNRITKKIYLSVIVVALITSAINTQILFGDYGAFDGRGLNIDKYSATAIIQLLVFIIVALSVVFSKIRKSLIVFSLIFLVFNFTLSVMLFSFNDRGAFFKKPKGPPQGFGNLSKDNPNYLYIILDEVYGESTKRIFHDKSYLANKFIGFTNYTNTAGVFPTTIMSIPAIITGQSYRDGANLKEFKKNSLKTSPLLNTLSSNGFDYKFHTLNVCSHLPSGRGICSAMGTMGNGAANVNNDYYRALNLSLFSAVPDVLKKQVYRDANWLFSGSSLASSSRHIREFDYLVNNLKVLKGPPTFRLFHTTLTHSPIKVDSHCEMLDENLPRNFENYLKQDTCGFIQASRIIDKLKELGVYDNTYIVISSDHGRPFVPEEIENIFNSSEKNIPFRQYGYAHATLMVKPLNVRGDYKSSHQPMSLMDIAPLITNSINGNSYDILSERKYHYYNWSLGGWRKKTLPPFEEVYEIGDDIKNPSDWTLDERFMNKILASRTQTALKCNNEILFGSSKNKNNHHATGLSYAEPWGRWSNSKKVSLFFRLDRNACSLGKLSMKVIGFVRRRHPSQHSEVFLNNVQIGEININLGEPNPREFSFDIPSKLLRTREINILEFHIKKPVSPVSIGISYDARLLGLGFQSMVFK